MLELPVLDDGAAAAASMLAARLPVRGNASGQAIESRFPGRAQAGPPVDWPCIPGRLAGHELVLELGPGLLPASALAAFPALPEIGVPEALRALLLDLLLADLADAAQAALGERPSWEAGRPPGAVPHRLLVAAATPPGDLLAVLHLSGGALAWIAARAQALPVHRNDLSRLPVRAAPQLDRVTMVEAELEALTPGDVVLLERDPAGPDGALAAVVTFPGFGGFAVGLDGRRLTLISNLDAAMTDPDLPRPTLDGLRLPVDVTLGTLELPLSRLVTLAVGDVLDLGHDAVAQVVLRVNGQAVASGELVRIGGRTGVRILNVALARRAA